MLGCDFYWGEKLIIQLVDEEDKFLILIMVDTMLTKKKFKDFFQKNIATL